MSDANSKSLREMDQVMRNISDKSDVEDNNKADSYQQVLWRFLKRVGQYKDKLFGKVEIAQPMKPKFAEPGEDGKAE